ncbi:MAG: BCCT family transporter, partial [Gammaproteobacteria bacterium]|nr:BCCT family transporter [Gammaproteobacteria bacterium]
MDQSRIDWPSFIACVTIIALVCLPIAIAPDATGYFLQSTYDWIAREFGILYLLASVAAIGFLVWIAASRYGALKLGQDQDEPEFSQISWVAMLFCAGVGAGLIYWCATEWAYYYQAPPFGAEPRSAEAAEWASTYGLFHWGFTA